MVGNLKNYRKLDILRCLLLIEEPISRNDLSNKLELGEGTIRSILNILKNENFIISNKQGHKLSENGQKIISNIKNRVDIKRIDKLELFPNQKIIAIQVKNPKKFEKAYVLRDIAVKNGSEGAIILEYKDNKLNVIDVYNKKGPEEIKNEFSLEENDIVIISYAESFLLAEHGAFSVVKELNNDINNFIEKF